MISFFNKKQPFAFCRLRSELIPQCTKIHAESFQTGWDEGEFGAFLIDRAIQADCAIYEGVGHVLAFAVSKLILDEAEILSIAVGRRHHNQGIGRKLLIEHISNLNSSGIKSIFLEVSEENNAALKLYRRTGFDQIGRREGYYAQTDGSRIAAVTMKLSIS